MSIGTLVNREVTSNETRSKPSDILNFVGKIETIPTTIYRLILSTLCKIVAKLCNGLPVDYTITRSGKPFLWILGKP